MSDLTVNNLTALGTTVVGLGLTAQSVNAPGAVTAGSLAAVGPITGQSLSVPGQVACGNLNVVQNGTVSGNLNVSGQLVGGTVAAVGPITGQSVSVPGSVVAGSLAAVGRITGQSISVPEYVNSGTLNVGSNATIGGSLTVAGPTTYTGGVSFTGPITAPSATISGNVSSGSSTVSGALTAASASVSGAVAAGSASVSGAVAAGSASVSGAVAAGSASVSGALSAGSANVSGTTITNILQTLGTSSFAQSVSMAQNQNITGNVNVGGSAYYNGGIVVGDRINGNGVALDTSATTLYVAGRTQDTSGTSFLVNMSVNGGLTIPNTGTFNLYGLNPYEGAIQSGDVISVDTLGVVSPAQTNAYMAALIGPAGAGTFWQDTSYSIVINRIVYWGNDFLTNSIDKFSATLLVPFLGSNPFAPTGLPKNSAIVSYKHGTLSSTFQNTTLWAAMQEAAAGLPYSITSLPVDPTAWMLSCTGYVSVCADNVSYGKSIGSYDYQNVADEATSQYTAIIATTQLMRIKPDLFFGSFVGVSPVNVINSGYSLGGVQSVYVSQLIKNDDIRNPYANTNANNVPIKLVQTIAGAPLNAYELLVRIVETNYNNPTLWSIMLLTLLSLGDPQSNGLKQSVRPNIYSDVYPALNQYYANTNLNSVSQFAKLQATTFSSVGAAYSTQNGAFPTTVQSIAPPVPGLGYTFPTDASNNYTLATTGYITPNQFYRNPYYTDCSAHNFALNTATQIPFYTNNFVDYSDLSGTPICVIYSTGDELACNNAGSPAVYNDTSQNIYVGIPSKDTIYTAYKAWVDASNSLIYPNSIWTQRKTWIDTSGGFALGGYTTTNPATNPIASVLLSTENLNRASIVRVNKDNITPGQNIVLQHSTFLVTVFQLGVRVYLNSRT